MKTVKTLSYIGVWMDHTTAKLIGRNGDIKLISHKTHPRIAGESGDTTRLGNFRTTNNEVHKHNIIINDDHKYFNEVFEAIKNYDEIFLFGPSHTPNEFHNYILKHKKYNGKIDTESCDYMTDNQLFAMVQDHFHINS